MKRVIAAILSLVLVAGTLAGCSNNGAVATVNGKPVTKEYFDKNFKMFEYQYTNQNGENSLTKEKNGVKAIDTAKSQVLNQIVQEQVVYDYMMTLGKKINGDEIAKSLSLFKESIKDNAEYKKFLEDNKIDDKFLSQIIERNMTVKEFEKTMNAESKFKPEDAIIRAGHILVEKESKAKSIYQKLKEGADFSSLAKSESKDASGTSKGGDLGYFTKGIMVPEFENAAFSMKVGEISKPVKSQFGYHIIKVTDKSTIKKFNLKRSKMKKADYKNLMEGLQRSASSGYTNKKYMEIEKAANVTKDLEAAKK